LYFIRPKKTTLAKIASFLTKNDYFRQILMKSYAFIDFLSKFTSNKSKKIGAKVDI